MFCTNCGAQISDDVKFCTNCGTPVAAGTSADLGTGGQASPDRTVMMPSAAQPAPGGVVAPAAPGGYAYSARTGSSHGGHGLAVVAVIMSILAVVAVGALVFVMVDPLGLRQSNGGQEAAEAEQPAAEESTDDPETVDVNITYETTPAPSPAPEATPEPSSPNYVLPDSSSHLYSADELSGLSNWELYLARNEIYARHGRMFQKEDLQSYFNGQSWYTPRYAPEEFDSLGLLSDVEQQNAATMLELEQSRGSEYL